MPPCPGSAPSPRRRSSLSSAAGVEAAGSGRGPASASELRSREPRASPGEHRGAHRLRRLDHALVDHRGLERQGHASREPAADRQRERQRALVDQRRGKTRQDKLLVDRQTLHDEHTLGQFRLRRHDPQALARRRRRVPPVRSGPRSCHRARRSDRRRDAGEVAAPRELVDDPGPLGSGCRRWLASAAVRRHRPRLAPPPGNLAEPWDTRATPGLTSA